MPTYALDPEFFEGDGIPFNEDNFTKASNGMLVSEFSGETATFTEEDLEKDAQFVLSGLKSVGVTSIAARYDGGSDEGFAYFGKAFKADEELSLEVLTSQLTVKISEIVEVAAAGDEKRPVMFMGCIYSREIFEAQTLEQHVKAALDFLAYRLACVLLLDGFGTGVPGVMFGAFKANLETGEIVDEYAEAPEGTFDPFE